MIITADHGESFGDHQRLRPRHRPLPRPDRRPAGDPLPGRARGPRRDQPVSLRDLPATVVDQFGLSAGSPFPGHSLAAFWRSSSRTAASEITPALSEIANADRFQPQPGNDLSRRGFQMSLVARAGITFGTARGPSSSTT